MSDPKPEPNRDLNRDPHQAAPNGPAASLRPGVADPSAGAGAPPPASLTDPAAARKRVADALRRARREGRRVLVVFGADWCPDSRAFDEARRHPLVAPLLALGLEVVELDVGARDRFTAMAEGWGIDYAAGIPAVAVLDGEGELVAATRDGELRNARSLSPIEIATLVHRWLPATA